MDFLIDHYQRVASYVFRWQLVSANHKVQKVILF